LYALADLAALAAMFAVVALCSSCSGYSGCYGCPGCWLQFLVLSLHSFSLPYLALFSHLSALYYSMCSLSH
jgi:hypothetical protein